MDAEQLRKMKKKNEKLRKMKKKNEKEK